MLKVQNVDKLVHDCWLKIAVLSLLLGWISSGLITTLITNSRNSELMNLLRLDGSQNLLVLHGFDSSHPSFIPHWLLTIAIALAVFLIRISRLKSLCQTSGVCTDAFFERVQSATKKVPEKIARFVAKRGYRVYVGQNLFALDTTSESRVVAGVCHPTLKVILIAERVPYSDHGTSDTTYYHETETLAHEIGHAIDLSINGSNSLLFIDSYRTDQAELPETALELLPYCVREAEDRRRELFAELFASMIEMSANPFLEESFPRCSDYVRTRLKVISK